MIQAVLPALELLQLQLKEEIGALVELSQQAREHGDPVTVSVVKGHLLARRVDRLKLLGDLLTSARRVGCTMDQKGAFGEYILNELQEELSHWVFLNICSIFFEAASGHKQWNIFKNLHFFISKAENDVDNYQPPDTHQMWKTKLSLQYCPSSIQVVCNDWM